MTTTENKIVMKVSNLKNYKNWDMDEIDLFFENLYELVQINHPESEDLTFSHELVTEILENREVDVFEYFGNYLCTVVIEEEPRQFDALDYAIQNLWYDL